MSPSDRPSLERAWHDVRTIVRLWPLLLTMSGVVLGAWRYLESRFDSATSDVRAVRIAVEANAKDRADERAEVLERLCILERELVDEVGSRVSYQAADAEPNRARRAESARVAIEAYEAAARRWPCPIDDRDRAERLRMPLNKAASNALSTSPPR